MALSLCVAEGKNWICVNAAAEGWQKRTEMMERVAAAGKSSEREQTDGGEFTKVEASERRRQERNERGTAAEVHLSKWISVEYREEVHEKIQRKMRYLLWD